LNDEVYFAVVADEALHAADLRPLVAWLSGQPTWSDLPFIILSHHSDTALPPETHRLAELLGNVTLIERPFHPLTFLSVARTVHKGRLRQYEARALIEELRRSEECLERRVAERTAELNRAHAAVLEQMAQRERAEEKLRQAQKMETIGQLTGGVAHDFNNLLMAVIANLELLRKRAHADPTALKLIEGATQGAQRGAVLTQRLLAFARRQDLKLEPTNLPQLVRGMRDLIERSIGREIELVMTIDNDVPPVLIDANQVELAILNLAVNARDAMPNGGKISIAIDQPILDPSLTLPPGSFVRLAVTDTGVGMDSETLMKATEPFFSTKELGKGTGLGLSMIHGLARQLDGAFRLSSTPGHGTTAEFWMPATTRPINTHAVADLTLTEAFGPKLTILVVDDDALILMSTASMVEDLGHDVLEATSGAEALKLLRSGRKIDLLITDFSMPKMNGAQLAKSAKEIEPNLPVLLATGYAEIPGGSDPGFPRLGKPYHQEQLAAAIAETIKAAAATRTFCPVG
jgi:signal transduction histidine kinase/ActR/RegA family two-component response regulator